MKIKTNIQNQKYSRVENILLDYNLLHFAARGCSLDEIICEMICKIILFFHLLRVIVQIFFDYISEIMFTVLGVVHKCN